MVAMAVQAGGLPAGAQVPSPVTSGKHGRGGNPDPDSRLKRRDHLVAQSRTQRHELRHELRHEQEHASIVSLLQSVMQCGLPRHERRDTLERLREFWCSRRDGLEQGTLSADFIDQWLDVTEYLCDWRLRAELLDHALQSSSASAIHYTLQLAYCHFKLGETRMALDCLWPLVLQHPWHAGLLESHQQLRQRIECSALPAVWEVDDDVCLLPLEMHHMQDFYWQFDERIAELCNLPDFRTSQQWTHWLQCNQANAHKQLFALMHRQWGFAGSVCLEVHGNCGFFYYWLGDDYQAQGLGPRAVAALLDLGTRHLGMQCCYCKVYDSNLASIKAVEKIGFGLLPFPARAPYDNELFFYRGEPLSEAVHLRQLSQLLESLDSQIMLSVIYTDSL